MYFLDSYVKNSTTHVPKVQTTTGSVPDNGTNATVPLYVGFISAGVAVLFFGSNFVPVKKFETGDGKLIAFDTIKYVFMNLLIFLIKYIYRCSR